LPRLLEDTRVAQPRELAGLHPEEGAQHMLGVLPETRRGYLDPRLLERSAQLGFPVLLE